MGFWGFGRDEEQLDAFVARGEFSLNETSEFESINDASECRRINGDVFRECDLVHARIGLGGAKCDPLNRCDLVLLGLLEKMGHQQLIDTANQVAWEGLVRRAVGGHCELEDLT